MKFRAALAVVSIAAIALGGCSFGSSSSKSSGDSKPERSSGEATTASTAPKGPTTTLDPRVSPEHRAELRTTIKEYCAELAPAWRNFSHPGDPTDGYDEAEALTWVKGGLGGLGPYGEEWYVGADDAAAFNRFETAAKGIQAGAGNLSFLISNPPADVTEQLAAQSKTMQQDADTLNQVAREYFGIPNCTGT